MAPPPVPNDSTVQPLLAAWHELWAIASAQPGGVRAGAWLLDEAMRVLWTRPMLAPETVTELYAPVEPCIPIASLA